MEIKPCLNQVYIYGGPGASSECVSQTVKSLSACLPPFYKIHILDQKCLIKGHWTKDAAILIIPGGRDLPYVRDLTCDGNNLIRTFINQGGSFLGICAGAYYASSYVEFSLNTPNQVIGPRELALFQSTVKGPMFEPFDYSSNECSRAITLRLKEKNYTLKVFYKGGGYFVDVNKHPKITTIASYENYDDKPAIIAFMYGKGRVVLSGVHFEFNPHFFDINDPYLLGIQAELIPYEGHRIELINTILKLLKVHAL